MEKRWTIRPVDEAAATMLQQSLNIHPVLCRMLTQRGIQTFEAAKDFFRPELSQLHDPFLMKDMDKAVARIIQAMERGERVMIFGDYDVDGTTSVASLFSFLKKIHTPLDYYVPHRYREGYGVSRAGIDHAQTTGVTLIISIDCGIKSVELITYAKSIGIDFIICDHHLPDEQLPPAVAILNAKQADCPYPYKELCGCGVGYKLMTALTKELELPEDWANDSLDLLATAIAADIVPMTGENRITAYHGLRKANINPNNGIRALSKLSGLQQEMLINNLVFMIAPRVNAAGRMDDARKAVQLFLAETEAEALMYAEMLHSDNSDRKEADLQTTREALEMIGANEVWRCAKSTVLFAPHWHKGVVGIVASRVIEQYYRPTIILTQSGDYVAGSARSVPGFNLYEAIHACREHLLGYGGHFAAAGMTMQADQVDAFRKKFEAVVCERITEELLIPEVMIDAELRFTDISWTFYNIISQMEPFGPDNPQPQFVVRGVRDNGQSRVVKEQHLRVCLSQDGVVYTGIGFGMSDKMGLLTGPVDVVFRLDVNEWNGSRTLQLRVIDLRASA